MRALAITIASSGLFLAQLHAGSPPTRCFDADSDSLFSTAEVIAIGMSLEAKMPQIEADSEGKATKLTWVMRPDDTSIQVEQVGRYRAKGIYRVIYRRRTDAAESAKPEIACVMFGYQETTPDGMVIRPFFITTEDIRWFESYFISDQDQPFALSVHKTIPGNGIYWSSYTFAFTPAEARIVSRSEGGRRMHTKTYSYDKSGKITKTETSTQE